MPNVDKIISSMCIFIGQRGLFSPNLAGLLINYYMCVISASPRQNPGCATGSHNSKIKGVIIINFTLEKNTLKVSIKEQIVYFRWQNGSPPRKSNPITSSKTEIWKNSKRSLVFKHHYSLLTYIW